MKTRPRVAGPTARGALDVEALERFVYWESLRRVRGPECTIGVLALVSEPVDPRLQVGSAQVQPESLDAIQ